MNTVENTVTETAAALASNATVQSLRDFICASDDFNLLRETLRLYAELPTEG